MLCTLQKDEIFEGELRLKWKSDSFLRTVNQKIREGSLCSACSAVRGRSQHDAEQDTSFLFPNYGNVNSFATIWLSKQGETRHLCHFNIIFLSNFIYPCKVICEQPSRIQVLNSEGNTPNICSALFSNTGCQILPNDLWTNAVNLLMTLVFHTTWCDVWQDRCCEWQC